MSNYNVNLTDITDTRQVNVNVTTGDKGWSAELVMVRRESDGALVALREWIGGSGEKPTPPQYVTEDGFTDDIEEAVPFDIAPQTLYQSEVGKIGITDGNEIDLNTVNLEGDQTIDGNKEWTGEQTLTTLSGVGDRVVVADELGKLSANAAIDDFEMVANKATSFDTIDDSLYPTTQAVADFVDDYVDNYVGDGTLSVTTTDGLSGSVSFSANQSGDAQLEIGVDEGYVLPTIEDWNDKADLVDGKVPSTQLPSYVDDVLEFPDFASLPAVGESGKIYVTLDDNKIYRWSGSAYVQVSESLALGETSSTAYRGDRGKVAYDYSQVGHLPLAGGTVTGQIKRNGDAVANDDVPRFSQVVNTSGNQTGIAGDKTWTGINRFNNNQFWRGAFGVAILPDGNNATTYIGSTTGTQNSSFNNYLSGSTLTSFLDIRQTNGGSMIYPLHISGTGNDGNNRGTGIQFNVASSGSSAKPLLRISANPLGGVGRFIVSNYSTTSETWTDIFTVNNTGAYYMANKLATEGWVTSQNYLTKNKYLDIVQVTANRNLLATDAGKNLIIEASATITVQNSTSQAFAVGDVVDIRVALGSTLTIAASTGVTIYYDAGTLSGTGSFDIAGFKRVRVVCEAEDVFSIG